VKGAEEESQKLSMLLDVRKGEDKRLNGEVHCCLTKPNGNNVSW